MPADWRDEAAAGLAARNLRFARPGGPALVVGDSQPEVPAALGELGLEASTWQRRALGGAAASVWPPPGPFGTVCLRLPKAKEELDMLLHLAASRLDPGGTLLVYGAGDEGARSVPRRMEELFDEVSTVATASRCRLLRGVRRGDIAGVRGEPPAWRETFRLEGPGLPARPWVSYPGLFAHGRLDEGTALLMDELPSVLAGLRPEGGVLDFGCGSGVLGAAALEAHPDAAVDLLDVDALAVKAARENVPGARSYLLGSGLEATDGESYDVILSNPPYHLGKAEALGPLDGLVAGAPSHLRAGGSLVMVLQRRLPAESRLAKRFREVESLADSGPYRIWRGSGPR